jgi:hypothetical protein
MILIDLLAGKVMFRQKVWNELHGVNLWKSSQFKDPPVQRHLNEGVLPITRNSKSWRNERKVIRVEGKPLG